MATPSKPKKSFTDIQQVGKKALALHDKHQAEITDRLTAGTVSGLREDLPALRGLVPGVGKARRRAKAATADQADALKTGHALVSAVRQAVARRGKTKAVRTAYGVGAKLSAKSVKSVSEALGTIHDRAAKKPEEARAMGIVAADVTKIRAAIEAIEGADDVQESLRAAAPQTTRDRNQAARRILAAVDEIATAGAIAFAHQPAIRKKFEALLGHGARKRKKK
jgi:hypothetical protein